MRIPVYRIQNVLDAFGKHIVRAVENQVTDPGHDATTCSPVIHAQAALRQTIIDHFENGVVERVYSLTKGVSGVSAVHEPKSIDALSRDNAEAEMQVLRYCRIDSEGCKNYCQIDLSQFH
jgi:acyl-CoA reductase-like NAD-dependent aldehyde dehydrogenase